MAAPIPCLSFTEIFSTCSRFRTIRDISYVPLKTFLVRRLFPERACLLFYDISDGLTFGSGDMQKRFFEWLEVYDNVENTNFHQAGPPRDFIRLAPLLRRFLPARRRGEGKMARHHADH